MIKISHRGNINGPQPNQENHPDYVQAALDLGYHVEVDVRLLDGDWYFGHDAPQYRVDPKFLHEACHGLWIHCKNIQSLHFLSECGPRYNYFWHENDAYVLTSRSYIWTFPGKEIIGDRHIAVMPELVDNWDWFQAFGVCSDYVGYY